MAEPSWQELLRLRLAERNARESAFSPIIEQYRKLAQQTKLLKERNASLLRAVGSVRVAPGASAISGAPAASEDNPVRAAYMASLESQISSLRDELATVYKTQGQNAQRLLSMNETLREKEELSRVDSESLRKTRDEIIVLRRKVDQHSELMAEKDRTVQVKIHLFFRFSTTRSARCSSSSAKSRAESNPHERQRQTPPALARRQAGRSQQMNEANEFYENMRSRHHTVLTWRDGSADDSAANGADSASQSSVSGNGDAEEGEQPTRRTDGTPSPAVKAVDLTPNG
ncbi:autophagy protein 16-domain-containing protein [Mycena rosella]|uniref:Autophagy protein 16-domain-containing protein n=1 Tax=Mycena rosella TaxID=1033263 RepID=A0AAD7GWA9_MYCRO|nr:autophagy protein 16-domain-containing protein [Mycena rosella]